MLSKREVAITVLCEFLVNEQMKVCKQKGKVQVQFGLCTLASCAETSLAHAPTTGADVSDYILRIAYLFPEEVGMLWESFFDLAEAAIQSAPSVACLKE